MFVVHETDRWNLLWNPIRAELTSAVLDKIQPINKQHHRFFLHLTQSDVKF